VPTPQIYVIPAVESLSDLLRRVADRDQAAFGRLYRRLVRPVFAQIRESLGSPAPAVPVTRAVFVEVWRLAPVSAARGEDVLAWVSAIATRRAADRLHALNHRPPAVDTGYDAHLRHELAAALGAESQADPGSTPASGLP
jgi:DNA-directed RNA polymerase specialized sigma24 family protein